MKIILLGYMGSGKSTIGKALSKHLSIPCIDLDDYIQEKEQKMVNEIFSESGEIYFRKKERFYLEELLERKDDFILALGGGTPCYYDTMDFINSNTTAVSIYLKTDLDTLVKRLASEKNSRPLISKLNTEELLREFIAKHVFERSYFYNKAQFVIDNVSIEESIKKIKSYLK
jgi:shikimate kinase